MMVTQPSLQACTPSMHSRSPGLSSPGKVQSILHPAADDLHEVFPHLDIHHIIYVLEQKHFDVEAAAAELASEMEGTQSSTPDMPCGSVAHKSSTTHVSGSQFSFLFPEESVQAADECLNMHEHKHALTPVYSAPVQQCQHISQHSCPEGCLGEQSSTGKCRHWWQKYDAKGFHILPTPAEWDPSHQHRSRSPARLFNSANPQAKSSSIKQSSSASAQFNVADVIGKVKVSEPTSNGEGSQLRQQAGVSFDSNIRPDCLEPEPAANSSVSPQRQPGAPHRAPLFVGDNTPTEADAILDIMRAAFSPGLSDQMLANTLQEAHFDVDVASDKCLYFLEPKRRVADGNWSDSSPSDYDASSVSPESLAEAMSPMHGHRPSPLGPLDDSECLQELDFEDKVAKLKEEVEFCQLSHDEVVQQLVAADGSYDTAYSLLLEHVDELEQQKATRQAEEVKDRAVALKLQEQESSVQSGAAKSASDNSPILGMLNSNQAGEVEWLVAKDPSMKPKLDQLKSDYPQVSHEAMQDLLAANEGDLMQTVKCLHSQMPEAQSPTSKGTPPVRRLPPAAASVKAKTGHPITPPPGFGYKTPASASSASSRHRSQAFKHQHNDLYTEARKNFRDAQDQMQRCKQDFYAAIKAGNRQKQQACSDQMEYWQQKLVEEKQKAHKKIFSKKNADVSNTFKVDLHALHVDEALEELQKTMDDLSHFQCTWMVEAITGKGLHSVGQDPKLLPAVKEYLAARSVDYWEVPGMVVFKIYPSDNE